MFVIALENEMLLLENRLWSVQSNKEPAWLTEKPFSGSKIKKEKMHIMEKR